MAELSGCIVNDVSLQQTPSHPPPNACKIEPSPSKSHHVSACCSSQPVECCCCHDAPLSHMMGKVYSIHPDFLMVGNKL